MKVLLVDIDSKIPNLALMKISAQRKALGDQVRLQNGFENPDRVYLSCVFAKNRAKTLGLAKMFNCPVEIGGYGVNTSQLPHEVEHAMPDYGLYHCDYSMGFTSRGCIRRCPWCIVPTNEGKIRDHASLQEFLRHKKLILLDNNFLASPRCQENLEFLIDRKIQVNFNQGLDIRLVDGNMAQLLAKTGYRNRRFGSKRLYFAFDQPSVETEVVQGIEELKKAGIPPNHLMFYILVGYNTSFVEDHQRFETLRKLGTLPYVMIYNDSKRNALLLHFERWVNGRYYRICDWKDYDHGDSQKWIGRLACVAG